MKRNMSLEALIPIGGLNLAKGIATEADLWSYTDSARFYYLVVYHDGGHFTQTTPDQKQPRDTVEPTAPQHQAVDEIVAGLACEDEDEEGVALKYTFRRFCPAPPHGDMSRTRDRWLNPYVEQSPARHAVMNQSSPFFAGSFEPIAAWCQGESNYLPSCTLLGSQRETHRFHFRIASCFVECGEGVQEVMEVGI
jgi:hypothetical protein